MPKVHRPDLHGFLDRLKSRSTLTEEEQEAVLNLPGRAEQVRPNRDFVRIGERVDYSCLVVAGIVAAFGQNSEGARQITAMHLPGEMANLHSVVQPVPTSALQALSTATVLQVPNTAIRAASARYPAVAEALWRDCMVDGSILSQWIVNVGRRDARTRIAHLFCEMGTRLGARPPRGDAIFPFAVTQSQLADATGLTPVHVNRTLMALKAEGLMTVHGQVAWIHDWERLAGVGDFDAAYLQMSTRPQQRMRLAEAG